MAVQQNKKSPSKRGMHRAHDFLTNPPLAVEATTGEVHLRHHISPTGFYRGKKVLKGKGESSFSEGQAAPLGAPAFFCHDNPHRHRLHGGRPRSVGDGAGGASLSW